MRPIYVLPNSGYRVLNGDLVYHHENWFSAVFAPWDCNDLQTLKIRDRLGLTPRLNGDGPFFGANIPPYAVDSVSRYAPPPWDRYDYWVMATGYLQGTPYYVFQNYVKEYWIHYGDRYCKIKLWYRRGQENLGWYQCDGNLYLTEDTDLEIQGKHQFRMGQYQFLFRCTGNDTRSWSPEVCSSFAQWLIATDPHELMSLVLTWGLDSTSFCRRTPNRWWYRYELYEWNITTVRAPSDTCLRYSEWDKARALASGMSTNFYYSGCNAAFQACVDGLPVVTVNTAQNIMDVVEALWSLMTKGISVPKLGLTTIPKNAGEAWMFYRYVYCTSKSDLEEYVALTRRLADIAEAMPDVIYAYGQYYEGDYTFHCVMKLSTADVLPKDVRSWLHKFGVKLSIADLWDDVPYSFVVDWFLNIGDILSYIDSLGRAIAFRNKECWYSVTTAYNGINTYVRVPGSVIPYFPPAFHFHDARLKTWIKRFVDGLVLLGP